MRIPRPVLALLALPLTLSLTGCISSYTLVKVKPDGTGTVEQTTMVSQMMMGMMSGMAQGMSGEKGSKSKPPSVADMFKEDELRAAAAQMGTGVRFVSSTPAKADGKEGVTALYAFDDVTKLSVSQNMKTPGKSAPSGPADSPMVFALAPAAGGSKILSIKMPEKNQAEMKKAAAAKKEKTDGPGDMKDVPPEMLAMMKGMFQGAKIGIDVEVAGNLIKSNSPYVTGSRVTLMEVDLGALMEDPTRFQKLQELGPGASFEEARKVLGDVKGIKLPPGPVTTIEWR